MLRTADLGREARKKAGMMVVGLMESRGSERFGINLRIKLCVYSAHLKHIYRTSSVLVMLHSSTPAVSSPRFSRFVHIGAKTDTTERQKAGENRGTMNRAQNVYNDVFAMNLPSRRVVRPLTQH
nr:hypothetical protein BgiMline_014470 [Biomphalaria glabrata]